jgi:hypothetical protein
MCALSCVSKALKGWVMTVLSIITLAIVFACPVTPISSRSLTRAPNTTSYDPHDVHSCVFPPGQCGHNGQCQLREHRFQGECVRIGGTPGRCYHARCCQSLLALPLLSNTHYLCLPSFSTLPCVRIGGTPGRCDHARFCQSLLALPLLPLCSITHVASVLSLLPCLCSKYSLFIPSFLLSFYLTRRCK